MDTNKYKYTFRELFGEYFATTIEQILRGFFGLIMILLIPFVIVYFIFLKLGLLSDKQYLLFNKEKLLRANNEKR